MHARVRLGAGLVVIWSNADHTWLFSWTGLGVMIMSIRELQMRRYLRLLGEPVDTAAWTRWLEISLFANGCFWGIGCAALILIATPYQLPLLVLIVGGLQTGSVLSSSYILRIFALFSLPLFLFAFLAFLVLGFTGQPALLATAAILAAWSFFIITCARRFGGHYRRSLGYALENLDLAQSLRTKNGEIESLNADLLARIGELDETQRQLLIEKQRSDGLVAQLRELSATDGLTGLGNRRAFDERLASEWRRALRSRQPLALLLADVDDFKAYNDLYGHQMGDDCLIAVAHALASAARREGDWAARYGGEEFAIILSNTPVGAAAARAQHVHERLAELAIEHGASPTAPIVTLSVGVAGVTPHASCDPSELLAAADESLYAAKRAGRNRVVARDLDRDRYSATG